MASTAVQVAFNNGWNLHTPRLVSDSRTLAPWDANTPLGMLSTEAVRELESIMTIVNYDAGNVLFQEQELLKRVFIVHSGDVRLSMQNARGRRLTLQIARRGAVLGVHSALFETLTEWSAEAYYPSSVGLVNRDDFRRFAERHPELYRIAAMELIQTIGHTCSTLRIVGFSSSVRKRLATQLLVWGESGRKTGDQTQFRMAMTHEQIAEFIGSARESVTRALIDFKQLGLVRMRGSILTIPSTSTFRDYAERC